MTTHPDPMESAITAAIKALDGYKPFQGKFGDTAARVAIPAAISAYHAAQPPLSNELKAIAERHSTDLAARAQTFYGVQDIEQLRKDRAILLSFIPDVVRACAAQTRIRAIIVRTPQEVADIIQDKILSLLGQPIKSESQIREEEREQAEQEKKS